MGSRSACKCPILLELRAESTSPRALTGVSQAVAQEFPTEGPNAFLSST